MLASLTPSLIMHDHRRLIVWQKSRIVSLGVLRLSQARWAASPGALLDQLRRAATSVQLNIAEGYAFRPGNRWSNHLRIALGSALETHEILELIHEASLLRDPQTLRGIIGTNLEVQAMLRSMLRSPLHR